MRIFEMSVMFWMMTLSGKRKKKTKAFITRRWQSFQHVVKGVKTMTGIQRKECYGSWESESRRTRSRLKDNYWLARKSFTRGRSARKVWQWRKQLREIFLGRQKVSTKDWLDQRDIHEVLPAQMSGIRVEIRKKQGNIQACLERVWRQAYRAKHVMHKQDL